jgi:hypothetical protein
MAKRSAKRASTKKAISKKPVAKKTASKQKPKALAKPKAAAKKPVAPKKAVAKKTAVAPAKKSVAKKTVAKAPAAKKAVVAKAVVAKTPAPKAPAAKKAVVAKATPSAPRATPARDARSALARKRAIEATLSPAVDGKEVVDAYMRDVDHPFKAEMQAVRQIILGVSPKMSERIKWNAPSFFYKEDFAAFHPRATEFVHLIVLFPGGAGMDDDTGLLEGSHKDRREAKFYGMDDVAAKKPRLEKLVKRWLALRDA